MKSREIAALIIGIAGAVIMYAGATGWHTDDALRVILGKPVPAGHKKRGGFGKDSSVATGSGSQTRPAANITSTTTPVQPPIDNNRPQTGANGGSGVYTPPPTDNQILSA